MRHCLTGGLLVLFLAGAGHASQNEILPGTDAKATLQAAEQGDVTAQLKMGRLYTFGSFSPQDQAEATKWFTKAAEQGNAEAQCHLGEFYSHGAEGLPQDADKAIALFRKSAEQGSICGQYNLGVDLTHGKGSLSGMSEQDRMSEAAHWYRKAAEQGYVRAQVNLGALYSSGQGVEADILEAVKWYDKAAKQGDPMAFYNLAKIEADISKGRHPEDRVYIYIDYTLAIEGFSRAGRRELEEQVRADRSSFGECYVKIDKNFPSMAARFSGLS